MLASSRSTGRSAVRVARVSEFKLLVAIKHQVWGATRARSRKWTVGDYLVLKDASGSVALVPLASHRFHFMTKIRGLDVYPYRISVEFPQLPASEDRPAVGLKFRQVVAAGLGPRYGIRVRTQSVLPKPAGQAVIKLIRLQFNSLPAMQRNLDSLLAGDLKLAEMTSKCA